MSTSVCRGLAEGYSVPCQYLLLSRIAALKGHHANDSGAAAFFPCHTESFIGDPSTFTRWCDHQKGVKSSLHELRETPIRLALQRVDYVESMIVYRPVICNDPSLSTSQPPHKSIIDFLYECSTSLVYLSF